ncbi:MAG TPA: hypothetical protein VHX52_04445 [Steroidobacteraceae bacterium]|nr:hypothetical protein [Steroidobacteraceae bacterium]
MLTVDGVNLGLQTGSEGTVVVNPGPAGAAQAVSAAIRSISDQPIRFIIDTSADAELTGGNAAIAGTGQNLAGLAGFNLVNGVDTPQEGHAASIVGTQAVLQDLILRGQTDAAALPTETFTRPQYDFYLNGQGIDVIAEPRAHSDADSVVLFRRSDVLVTGALLDMTHWPVIDVAHGGGINGEIDAINRIMNTLVDSPAPILRENEGTLVIPVRGPVCDQADLLAYRDMLWAVRERVQYGIEHGKSLAQIEASDPTQGYNTRYGADGGAWSTHDFIAAVYKSLQATERAHGRNNAGAEP